MNIRFFALLGFSLLLVGCVSAPMPVPSEYHGPLARVGDTSSPISSTKIQFFELAKVDGRVVQTSSVSTRSKNFGRGFYMEPQLESREVPAKTCVLTIEGVTHVAADILAFGGGMYHVEGDVTVTLDATKKYLVKGVLSKEYCAVWLEDSVGNIISSKIEKGKKP